MSTITKFTGFEWQEDGSATLWARVTARHGTGAVTGVLGEGNFVKQADLASITCNVFDKSGLTPTTPITSPTVAISSVILDAPDASGLIAVDNAGNAVVANFFFDLLGTNFPTGGHAYLVEVYFSTTGGSTWCLAFESVASPVVGS